MFITLIYILLFLFLIVLIRKYANGAKTNLSTSMKDQVIIVTGSNTGIGKVTAVELLKNGATVIFACRDEKKTLVAINSINSSFKDKAVFLKLDLSSFDSISSFVNEFKQKFGRLDILINNAGAFNDEFSTKENIEKTIMTNHVGPVVLTALLINLLTTEGKIINVSSRAHTHVTVDYLKYLYAKEDFSNMKINYQHKTLYNLSKLGNVYHCQHLEKYFRRNHLQIKAASLHPGLVNSDFFTASRFNTMTIKIAMNVLYLILLLISKTVYMGAQTTLHLTYMNYNDIKSGAYYADCQEIKLKELHKNEEKMEEFMNFTKQLILKNYKNPPKDLLDYLNN